ncbi:formylglycine-generating enzyme family protein [Pseudoxanthomonas koreensis]|uniref:formylglycine-generating enzyme family protein n=1 Tax=Pseudoxanthomonas koreensis TaxID=266061 RepID=UPI001390D871|nr:formylglycine-generating enzyme family protein [Pseudoxanthomonas koreensis]KAF1691238.1 serine/threonine kinase [Pseudoxanthomonas koreensis]
MLLLAAACGRAPEVPAGSGPAAAGGRDAGTRGDGIGGNRAEAGPSVTVSGDEREAVVGVWSPPPVELPADADLAEWRARADAALAEGRLFEDGNAAIPLYLALRRADPDDRASQRGLQRAGARVVAEARAAVAALDTDDAGLARAEELVAVARALRPDDAAVPALQRRVESARRLSALNRAGEEDLRAGRLGEQGNGALAYFRDALVIRADDPRALQGRAAVESAAIGRAEQAAAALEFATAAHWLDSAQAVREDDAGAVADARARIAAARAARIAALRDAALHDLVRPDGLRDARGRLAAMLEIAEPGDAVAAQLRERIDLATHYGAFRPGQVFTDALANGSRGPQMVVVPHGAFRMGALDTEPGAADPEKPAHYVRFDRGFAMSLTEVTVAEFGRFVAAAGARPRATRRGNSIVYDERSGNFARRSGADWRSAYDGRPAAPGDPVLHVSVRDAEAYAAWLSAETGRYYRLPSEAEFEYALRAGNDGRFPWGDAGVPPEGSGNFAGGNDVSPSGRTWNNAFVGFGDGYWGPAPAGRFSANAWGLHDLSGNVSEWVADCWHASYRRAPADGAAWFNPGCRSRVVRGGVWSGSPAQTRSAWRAPMDSDMTSARVGFRLVRGI